VDLHLARQMVLSLEFSTQHRRLKKLEGKMNELLNQKELLQSDYEAFQNTNSMLKDMLEEAKKGRALQIQETIKTKMLMGEAIAALDADLLETTGRTLQLETENTFLCQQLANMVEVLSAKDQKLKDAESANATLITEKVVLENLLYSYFFAQVLQLVTRKLGTIFGDQTLGHSETAHNVLPHKLLDLMCGDLRDRLCLHPLREILYGDDQKLHLPHR